MGTQRRDPDLAIRTIVVTTRAAVSRHVQHGRPDLAHRCVERGRELLADLEETSVNGVGARRGAAVRELDELDLDLDPDSVSAERR
jgi:hypothetical protein